MDKIDQQYLNEIVGGQEAGDPDAQDDLKVHEENTTIEELEVGKSQPCSSINIYLYSTKINHIKIAIK